MKKLYLLSLLFLFCIAPRLHAQVTVNATGGTLSANYTTLKLAFDAINAGTHTGSIEVIITASTTEGTTPATLKSGDTDPTSYSDIWIHPGADGVSVSGNPGAGFGVIQFNGADNVVLDGDNPNTPGTNRDLSIINTSTSTLGYTSCVRYATLPATSAASADNNFVLNCNIIGNVTSGNSGSITATTTSSNTSFGIYCGGKGSATTPTAITSETADVALSGTTINNLVIDNISVTQCGRGFVFNGAATSVCASLSITNSAIGSSATLGTYPYTTPASTVYSKGIWVAGTDVVYIANDTIRNIISYLTTNVTGIELVSNIGSGLITMDGNVINGVANNSSTAGATATGILVSAAGTRFDITNNNISTITHTSGTSTAGIRVATTGASANISKNKVSGVFSRNTGGWGAMGIHLASAANGATIYNNFVSDIMNVGTASFTNTDENATGILISSGGNHQIIHNSVHLSGTSNATGSNVISCFSVASNASTGLDIRNNIFSNVVSGGAASNAHVSMYFPFAITSGLNYRINNNAYYTGSVSGTSGVAFAGASTYNVANLYDAANFVPNLTTPATNFRSVSSNAGFDNNDVGSFASTAAAPFVSSTDLHITAGANRLESGGASTSVSDDIDGTARGTYPDIGADEFTGTILDQNPPLITYTPLQGTCTLGNRTLTVNIKDPSGVPTSGIGLPVLYWKINAGAYVAATGVSAGGGNYTFTFGAGAVVGDVVSYYIVAQDLAGTPNVVSSLSAGAGGFTANPPAASIVPASPSSYSVQNNLAPGTYNVGAGQTYTTLTAAVNAYNTSCLSGAVIFQLTDASYSASETFPISIGNPAASATNTLTIKPAAGVNAVITGSASDAIIKLNGADYVTIDGSNNGSGSQNLTITNSSSVTTSAAIWVASASSTNGATNNVIKNCIVTGSSTTSSYAAIVSCDGSAIPTVASAANSSNTYQNVTTTTAMRGIALIGPSAGDNNNIITACKVGSSTVAEKIGFRGIYIFNQNNININNNQVFGISSNQASIDDVTAGISVRGAINNGVIYANTIFDIKNTNTGAWTAHGITLQTTTSNTGLSVHNNMIYDIAGIGYNSRVQDNGFGIGILTGGGYRIYYNSINLNTNQSNGGYSAALFIDNRTTLGVGLAPSSLNIRNNIFSNQETTGTRYAIYSLVPASAFTNINYNDYYNLGTNLGFLVNTGYTTLAGWQGATGYDGNSVAVDPVFVSATNLHLRATLPNSPLDGQAQPIAGFTTDIDGDTRSATIPDIGADEFTPDPCVTNTGGTITSSSSSICVSANITITATGYATGTGIAYQWESSLDNITFNPIAGETNPSAYSSASPVTVTTYYRLRVTCAAGLPGYSNTVTVTVNNPTIASSAGATRCGVGTAVLTATGSSGTQVSWFDDPTSGSPLASNTTSFTTPSVSATTTFYAQALTSPTLGSVGPASPTAHGGTTQVATFNRILYFDVYQSITLVSVDVFPQTSGEAFNLQLSNSSGTVLFTQAFTTTVSGGSTPQTLTVNWPIAAGTQYRLTSTSMPTSGLVRNITGSTFPYTSTAVDITGSDLLPYYTYYYNWQYTSSCGSSPRTPVVVTVTAPPTLTTLSASPATVCEGSSSTLSANTTPPGTYTTYTWTPGSLSGTSVSVTPSSTTTYTVTASNATCATTGQVTVTVNPVPTSISVTVNPSTTVCAGSSVSMTAIGGTGQFYAETFETFPLTKFAEYGTGVTLSQNTTYFQQGSSSARLTPIDNADGGIASTSDINLSLLNTPVLSFYHICATESGFDYGFVQYSTDGGTNWNSFPTSSYSGSGTLKNGVVSFDRTSYSDWNTQFPFGNSNATPGAGPATALWKQETINLAPWASSTQFRVRFRLTTDGSVLFYGWLIDNIQITGQAPIVWSPALDLYTDAGATIPYTLGTNAPLIYCKPTASTTYTASAQAGTCTSSTTVNINYVSNPISLTIASAQGTTNLCGADTVDLSIPVQNTQGAPTVFYTWKKNGTNITGSATANATSSGTTINVASTVSLYPGMIVQVTSGTGFFQANTKIVNILSATQFTVSLVPAVAIQSGAVIAATASGGTVTTLRYADFVNGDVITCTMSVSGVACVPVNPQTSNSLTFSILPNTATSVSISAAPGSTICAGQSVTFTATPTNGGPTPTYEWFIGSTSQGAPSLSNTFTTTTLANGNVVSCRMYSSATNCAFPKAPYSNNITMTVNPSFPVSVTITANPGVNICTGTTVTFTATPTNGGVTPAYQWYLNGSPLPGETNNTYTSSTLVDLDQVYCVLTSSISSCATGNPATSNILAISVTTQTASVAITPVSGICAGSTRTYTATPTNGGGSPTYEWFINGASQGAPSATATLGPITPNNGDIIRVDMYSSLSCATPVPATTSITQTVNANPTATIPGSPGTLCGSASVPTALTATIAAGSGTVSTIQWRLGGSNIGGATNATYVTNVSGNYDIVVTNSNGCSVTSAVYVLNPAGSTLMSGTYTIGAVTATGASSVGTTITVASTANLVAGAVLTKTAGAGTLAANTVITNIIDATTFTVSVAPTGALSGASLAGTTCTNYISFANAIADLNSRSINGNVTFNVQAGYVETLSAKMAALGNATLNAASATRTITFQKNGSGANPKIISYTGTITNPNANPDGIFTIAGTDNVTIDGIDLEELASNNTPASTMEYGYGLFKLNAGDGVQNATIKNCTITLNKVNNTASTLPMVEGSIGILLINSTPTAATTGLTPTNGGTIATNGTNSNNKFYTNTIQNCNYGIVTYGFAASAGVGPAPTATTFLGDLNNDIGGTSAATGNTILNFGGGGVAASAGIRAANQWSINISYNNLNNNNGSGTNHAGALRGIFGESGTSANATINNNTVSLKTGATGASAWTAIDNIIGTTPLSNTVNINNNTIQNCNYSAASSPVFFGISNTSTATNVNINGNTVNNISVNNTSIPCATLINNTGTGIVNSSISNNSVTNISNAGLSGTIRGISVGNATNGTISTNTIDGISFTAATSTGSIDGIVSIGTGQTNSYNGNIVRNLSIPTTGTINGIREFGSSTGTKTIQNNQVYNFSTTAGGAGGATFNGIFSQVGTTVNITGNTVYALNSTGTTGGAAGTIAGINITNGTTVSVSKNTIYNLSSTSTGPVVYGMWFANTTAQTNTAFNNFISDLKAPAANSADAIRGIGMTTATATTTFNVYHNSIYLNATSTGAAFGTSGIYHTANATGTTGTLNLRNNIIYNVSTKNGTGLTVAFRRSGTALNNYAATSNNNLFYAGTPSAANLLYYDGTNSDQTLTNYKTRVSARDAASVSDVVNFTSTTDLHVTATNNCALEGAAAFIATVTDDIDGQLRSNTTPDIGADEFSGTNPVTLTVTNPSAICTGSGVDLTAGSVTTGSSGGTVFTYYTDAGLTTTLATPNNVTTAGTYYIKYNNGSCYKSAAVVVAPFFTTGTWLGIDNNWNNASNWCGGVPGSTTDITIPTGLSNYPILTGTTGTVRNITIAGTGNINIGTGTLRVAGTFTSTNAAINATSGTLELIGSAAQTVRADHFVSATINNLTVTNTNAVTGVSIDNTGAMLKVTGTVGFGSLNNAKLTTNDKLTLVSDAAATARVGDVTNNNTNTGNTINGKIVVERYYPGRRAWRLVAPPITSVASPTISASWQEGGRVTVAGPDLSSPVGLGTHITYGTPAPAGYDQGVNANSSVFFLNNLGWRGVPPNTNINVTDHNGYMLFVRGDRRVDISQGTTAAVNNTVLRTTGNVNVTPNGGSPLSLAGEGSYVVGAQTFNVWPNPYPSAIDFNKIVGNPGNGSVPNSFYLWDPTLTGSNGVGAWVTLTWNGTNYTPSPVSTIIDANAYIQSGAAFMVDYTGSINFRESNKVTGSNNNLFRPAPIESLRGTLKAKNNDGTISVNDGFLLMISSDFSNEVDKNDVKKLPNFAENIYIQNGGTSIAIERRKMATMKDTIFLEMARMKSKNYQMEFTIDGKVVAPGLTPVLEDLFLNTKTVLNMRGNTVYDFSVALNTASADTKRFRIVFRKLIHFTHVKAQVVNADIAVDWNVNNEMGIERYEIERSQNGTNFEPVGTQLSAGDSQDGKAYSWLDINPLPGVYYYRIRCIAKSGAEAYSDVVKVLIRKGTPNMYVFPNPVINSIIGLQMNQMPAGVYETILRTEDGQVVNRERITHAAGTASETIMPKNTLVSGSYRLEVIGPDKKSTILNVIVQTRPL